MATRRRENLNLKDSLPGIERLILTIGMMVTFGVVCFHLAKSGGTDQLLPCLTGLMGLIMGYHYGMGAKSSEPSSDVKTT